MSLKNLKLAAATPARGADPRQRGRERVLAYLADQKNLAAAEAEGRAYEPKRTIRRKNDAGQIISVEAPRRVKRGWFKDASGVLYFQIWSGAKAIELGKGVNAVVVPKLEELPAILDTLAGAVSAGELDGQIAAVAAERRANFSSKKS